MSVLSDLADRLGASAAHARAPRPWPTQGVDMPQSTTPQLADLLSHEDPLVRKMARYCDETPDGCWVWTKSQFVPKGYGCVWVPEISRAMRSHRVMFERLVSPIPTGMTIDHLCRVRLCCRPEHLEMVSNQENILRGQSPTAVNARKTHCKRGHPLDGANLALREDGRRCRTCVNMSKRARLLEPGGRS